MRILGTNGRLFAASFMALVATSFCFVLRALVINQWGAEFALTETQKGELLGVGLWPFAVSIVLLSFVIDRIGFRAIFWAAAACHVVGLAILLTAQGYWGLYVGTLILSLGNGAVEAAGNPLIASTFPDDKPRWINRFHAGWAAGLILGGVLAIALGDDTAWRAKIALMALPVGLYALLLLGLRFPASERVALGVSYRAMLAEAGWVSAAIILTLMTIEVGRVAGWSSLAIVVAIAVSTGVYAWYARSPGRPLFILFVLLMIPVATTELSTDSWISALMAPEMRALGLSPGWVLVYTSLIVFVVRLFAGSIVAKLNPIGTLALGSAAAAVGLFLLAGSTGLALLGAATVYGIGKSLFWGTSLAAVSEQFPKGGAVALSIVGGAGTLAAGIVGSVLIGTLQDRAIADGLAAHDRAAVTQLSATYLTEDRRSVFGAYRAVDQAKLAAAPPEQRELIDRLAEKGRKGALRDIALIPVLMLAVYLGLLFYFRRRGGYRPAPTTIPHDPKQQA